MPLLLSQTEAVIDNANVDLLLRRMRISQTKEARWADYFGHDYIYRPPELKHLCFYQFVMWYQRKKWTQKELKDIKKNKGKVLFKNPD